MPSGELQTVAENQLILSHIKKAFLFKKIPKVLELVVSLSHFVNDILKNIYFSCHILLHDPISLSGCLNFVIYWATFTFYLFAKININQDNLPTWSKSPDKNLYILRTKRAFKMKWKAFFIICKGLSLNQISWEEK